jgi:hypothetical protein
MAERKVWKMARAFSAPPEARQSSTGELISGWQCGFSSAVLTDVDVLGHRTPDFLTLSSVRVTNDW